MNFVMAGLQRVVRGQRAGIVQSARPSMVRRWAPFVMTVLLVARTGATAATSPPVGASTRLKRPGQPTAVTVSSVSGGEMVSWTAPANDGGSPITGYIASALTSLTCTTTGATTCTLTGLGLNNGEQYYIRVRAMNAVGSGKLSVAVTATAGQSPNCSTIGPGADLQYCPLAHADSASADLAGANLVGADLAHANLSGADLSNVNLAFADLTGVKLAGVNLTGVASGGIADGPRSLPANWQLVLAQISIPPTSPWRST